jgi:hypothetical protein
MGSDDFISDGLFDKYLTLLDEGYDFIGLKDVYFLTKEKLFYWEGYPKNNPRHKEPIGPCKLYSKKLMEKLKWRPWGDYKINKGLDSVVTKRLSNIKYKSKILSLTDIGEYCIDVKVDFNISDIKHFKFKKEYDYSHTKNVGFDFNPIKNKLIKNG